MSQKKGTNAGPFTSYSQQVDQIIKEGDLSLDPRMRLLPDLKQLITEKRVVSFYPILMMDANDD